MSLKFSKIDGSETGAAPASGSSSIRMGIENAPSKLIVKYIPDMYSRPLDAALRETLSNALDACSRAHIPFDCASIGLGDDLVASITDKGHGMTADALCQVYSQYGVSDKRGESASTGAFGLGAKSPLAYTDEFSVITRTESEGTLFCRAYRTPDGDFCATVPVPIDKEAQIDIWRDGAGRVVATDARAAREAGGANELVRSSELVSDPFEAAADEFPIFAQALDTFFDGERDKLTLEILKKQQDTE